MISESVLFFTGKPRLCWLLFPMLLLMSGAPKDHASMDDVAQPCMAEVYFEQYADLSCDAYSEDQFCFEFEVANVDAQAVGQSRFIWDLGDGRQEKGSFVEHCYNEYGTYDVTLYSLRLVEGVKLIDTNYYEVEINHVVVINEQNPQAESQGYVYYFDASGSFIDNDVTPIGFYWDFGDGKFGCTELATNVYDKPGEYVVQLLIRGRDDNGEDDVICGQKIIQVGS